MRKAPFSIANTFPLCPHNYQQRIESAFALLTAEAKSIVDAIAILEEIEHDLSQWYGNRRLII